MTGSAARSAARPRASAAPAEIVLRRFVGRATDTTLLLQETLHETSIGPDRWTNGRVGLASAAFAFFIYTWWNHRQNGEDKDFLRALNRALYGMVDDIVEQAGGDPDEIVEIVRTAFQEIQAAFRRMDAGDLSGETFSLRLQQVLRIALTDLLDIPKTLDPHSALQLSVLMPDTFANLGGAG